MTASCVCLLTVFSYCFLAVMTNLEHGNLYILIYILQVTFAFFFQFFCNLLFNKLDFHTGAPAKIMSVSLH